MKYLLTVLTNGRRDCLERSLAAFAAHVHPQPSDVFVMDDGGQTGGDFVQELCTRHGYVGTYDSSPNPIGMCKAHAHCWHAAATHPYDWVFHLEDDFVILRPVNLYDLFFVLTMKPHLKQMALVRAPWGMEIEHGGYIPQTPGWYERVHFGRYEWIETTRNWATNPALFKTELAREFPWPLDNGCETSIGPAIIDAYPDAKFGLWGWGEPWSAHIAEARQPGAFGY